MAKSSLRGVYRWLIRSCEPANTTAAATTISASTVNPAIPDQRKSRFKMLPRRPQTSCSDMCHGKGRTAAPVAQVLPNHHKLAAMRMHA